MYSCLFKLNTEIDAYMVELQFSGLPRLNFLLFYFVSGAGNYLVHALFFLWPSCATVWYSCLCIYFSQQE